MHLTVSLLCLTWLFGLIRMQKAQNFRCNDKSSCLDVMLNSDEEDKETNMEKKGGGLKSHLRK